MVASGQGTPGKEGTPDKAAANSFGFTPDIPRRAALFAASSRLDTRMSALHNERQDKFGTTAAGAMRSPYKRQAQKLDDQIASLNTRSLRLFAAASGQRKYTQSVKTNTVPRFRGK